ncbi:hypothetical protein H5410_055283 [Solanum commersonii]|uniref:Uncharacterized protein n=1 Tax=Solanum commersonii TaxID=4109 RepID=A0A9J5WI88_SOLCO|nr:hypothetical protein H5410_055283 [Solanum commersonii]
MGISSCIGYAFWVFEFHFALAMVSALCRNSSVCVGLAFLWVVSSNICYDLRLYRSLFLLYGKSEIARVEYIISCGIFLSLYRNCNQTHEGVASALDVKDCFHDLRPLHLLLQ